MSESSDQTLYGVDEGLLRKLLFRGGHVPSARGWRARVEKRLTELCARKGEISAGEINDFLRRHGHALDIEDVRVRAVLRKARIRVERRADGQWNLRA